MELVIVDLRFFWSSLLLIGYFVPYFIFLLLVMLSVSLDLVILSEQSL